MPVKIAIVEFFPTQSGKIRHPGAENVKQALLDSPSMRSSAFSLRLITPAALTSMGGRNFFEGNFAAIVLPGGSSRQQSKALGVTGRATIRQFVANGGGYLGICAGAFLALSDYHPERSLKLLRCSALEDWERGHKIASIHFTPDGAALLCNTTSSSSSLASVSPTPQPAAIPLPSIDKVTEEPLTPPSAMCGKNNTPVQCKRLVRFNNGPCMINMCTEDSGQLKDGRPKKEDGVVSDAAQPPPGSATFLATYLEDLRKDDDTRVVGSQSSKGTGAIAQGLYGKGRVLLISPHLESTDERATKAVATESCSTPESLPFLAKTTAQPDRALQATIRRAAAWVSGAELV